MAERNLRTWSNREFASFLQRYCAMMIDMAIILILMDVIAFFALAVFRSADAEHLVIAFLVQALVFVLYFCLFLSSPLRATPGKLAMKIQVLREDGLELKPLDVIYRLLVECLPLFAVPLVSWLYNLIQLRDSALAEAVVFSVVCLVLLYGFGYSMILFTPKRQSLFDQLSHCVVTNKYTLRVGMPYASRHSGQSS
jgi:uncharacterized RDD family membrane protein YckC